MPDDIEIRVLRQRANETTRPFLEPLATASKVRSLYVHVPFCAHKCHYCDFYSIVDRDDRQRAFTDRLIAELAALAPLAAPLDTIFVGGGTPTLLAPAHWQRLLRALHDHYALAPDAEFTVEANPETVTPDLLSVLRDGGVNRISMGAQSFDPRHLKTLERWHDPDNVERAADLARAAGIARLSIDLIFAVPGQTPADWASDLARALAMGTEHLSCYALTYEPGTAMTARLARGEFERADPDLEADLYEQTLDTLRAHGLDRYEVSNFARPGAECRHNLAYWRQHEWLAAGPSASGHVAGHLWKNVPRLDEYLENSDAGFAPVIDHESPDARRALAERLMLGVRLREGLDAADIHARAHTLDPDAPARLDAVADRCRSLGWIADDRARWRLTDAGFLFADRVAST
ncbi:MAG: radical SAM family heme chaperone HemW [Phycisphaerales bacterium]